MAQRRDHGDRAGHDDAAAAGFQVVDETCAHASTEVNASSGPGSCLRVPLHGEGRRRADEQQVALPVEDRRQRGEPLGLQPHEGHPGTALSGLARRLRAHAARRAGDQDRSAGQGRAGPLPAPGLGAPRVRVLGVEHCSVAVVARAREPAMIRSELLALLRDVLDR